MTVRRTYGGWFAACLVALGALILLDLNLAAASQSSAVERGRQEFRADGAIRSASVRLSPGDVMEVSAYATGGDVFGRIEFYIVEAGEGEAFFANRTPQHVYYQRTYDAAAAGEHGAMPEPLFFQRPTPPPGFDPSYVDMVWVASYAPGVTTPSTEEGKRYFELYARGQLPYHTPWVSESWAVSAHRFLVPALYLLAGAAIVLSVLHARSLWRAGHVAGGDPTESGVRIVELGGRYMRLLRGFLLGLGAPLLYVCWASLFLVWALADEGPAPNAAWDDHLKRLTAVALALTVAGWLAAVWRIQTNYARWRENRANPPTFA